MTMTDWEDILAQLIMEPITKITGELGQEDLSILEEKQLKLKPQRIWLKKGNYRFLILISGKAHYRRVIRNETVQWENPRYPGGYDDSIQAKDMALDRSKSKNKHARKFIKHEKFLGMEESLITVILQAVDKPFVEALKED